MEQNPGTGRGELTQSATPREIFADARDVHQRALRTLAAGDIRDAAEKAWCATKRATDALILERTGRLPETSSETSLEFRQLIVANPAARRLRGRYYAHQRLLHGDCFYSGLCDPVEDTVSLIRETVQYIDDAEQVAYP